MATKPILDLDDLTELPSVKINGALHPLRGIGMLAPMELHRLQRMSARYDAIINKADLTPEEEKEIDALPDRMCRTVLMAPDDVHTSLTDWHRMRVIQAFFELPLRADAGARVPAAAQPNPLTDPTIGEPSSLALSASTEAIQ